MLGAREMIRTGEMGMRTLRLISSTTSRVAGGEDGRGELACAETPSVATQKKRSTSAAGRDMKMQVMRCTNLPRREFRENEQQKSPTRIGAGVPAFSLAKNTQPLQLGRVAWLTALLPITVAGPRPICTALPHFPNLQVVNSVYGVRAGVSMEVKKFPCGEISGFSSWVCAFPLGRASLPGNLPGGRAHSGKCPWTASGRRAERAPCR